MILKSLADDVEFADLERMFLCFVTRHSCHSFFSTFALKQIVFGSEIKLQSNTKTRTLCISFDSYIKPQLETSLWDSSVSCISFDSYIKPQHFTSFINAKTVVYLLIPTSNHNYVCFFSLIRFVVYLLIPTSNHNQNGSSTARKWVVYLLIPTSNHNWLEGCWFCREVVYLLIPTSNHNNVIMIIVNGKLYIFWFLHQTTTNTICQCGRRGCISFDSYIKPQLYIIAYNVR